MQKRVDEQCNIPKDSTAHTYGDCKEDITDIIESLHKLKPFSFTPGRMHNGFMKITKSPLEQLDPVLLDQWLTQNKKKLAANLYVANDESENEDDSEEEASTNDSDDEDDS